jgi:hypothetical protein
VRGRLRYRRDPGRDVWFSPAATLQRRGGDCEDLAILSLSLLLAGGHHEAHLVIGRHCDGRRCEGHAWVEGADARGGFLFEATSMQLMRYRPPAYRPNWGVTKTRCWYQHDS